MKLIFIDSSKKERKFDLNVLSRRKHGHWALSTMFCKELSINKSHHVSIYEEEGEKALYLYIHIGHKNGSVKFNKMGETYGLRNKVDAIFQQKFGGTADAPVKSLKIEKVVKEGRTYYKLFIESDSSSDAK